MHGWILLTIYYKLYNILCCLMYLDLVIKIKIKLWGKDSIIDWMCIFMKVIFWGILPLSAYLIWFWLLLLLRLPSGNIGKIKRLNKIKWHSFIRKNHRSCSEKYSYLKFILFNRKKKLLHINLWNQFWMAA